MQDILTLRHFLTHRLDGVHPFRCPHCPFQTLILSLPRLQCLSVYLVCDAPHPLSFVLYCGVYVHPQRGYDLVKQNFRSFTLSLSFDSFSHILSAMRFLRDCPDRYTGRLVEEDCLFLN